MSDCGILPPMETELSKKLGVEHAIFGFTPFPAVAAAITRAGGFGVLGAVRYTAPDDLARDLDWMQEHTDGKPYGLDVVMPAKKVGGRDRGRRRGDDPGRTPPVRPATPSPSTASPNSPRARPPAGGSPAGWRRSPATSSTSPSSTPSSCWPTPSVRRPPTSSQRAHDRDVLVAALAGSARHARHHADAGIDIVVAQGYEAGGHTGEIASMVLVPDVVDAVAPLPVLAAGGIGSGEQIAAGLALGAQGVWLGSLWLTTTEADLHSRALTAQTPCRRFRRHRPLPRPHRQTRTPAAYRMDRRLGRPVGTRHASHAAPGAARRRGRLPHPEVRDPARCSAPPSARSSAG